VRNRLWIFVVYTALLAVAGCQSPPEMDVERQWADTMRRLNMFGFYPMTEDVQVGDVYLHAPPRDGSASVPRFSLARLASFPKVDLKQELTAQHERDRLSIQPLAAAKNLVNFPNCTDFDTANADETNPKCQVRLQRSAIPTLTVGRVTNAQLGAAGTYGNFGGRLGLGNSSQTAVTITLRNVQEQGLDVWRIDKLLSEDETKVWHEVWVELLMDQLRQLRPDRPDLVVAVCNGNTQALADEKIEVVIMNRVIYAGGIEYSFSRNVETAVKFALDFQSTLPNQARAPVIPDFASASSTAKGNSPATLQLPPVTADPTAAAGERLAGLMSAVTGESGTAGRTGTTTSFGVGTFGNLSLKEDFNRPIAVGAGSRIRYSFHEALAGRKSDSDFRNERFRHAIRYCKQELGTTPFNEPALRTAMGL
jgi:hypothetical protein